MKKRILTGDRTTGRLHLGHYVGSLFSRVRLQHEYDTMILLADVQALTTHFEKPGMIRQSILDAAIDNLSAGLDPGKVTLIQQSKVHSIAELTVYYGMLVSVNALRHNPTVKTEARQYGYNDLSYGFLGYPVSQTADITFCSADLVPVGDDQLPHMEQARKIIRRFNDLYGGGRAVLRVPEALVGDTPRLCGLDGQNKMGKSLGNAVYLSDDRETVTAKVRGALTDTGRIAVTDRGRPEVCTVASYHKVFNEAQYDNICGMCRGAAIGCVACKKELTLCLNRLLDPIRERREQYERQPGRVLEYIAEGSRRANRIGDRQLQKVREAMGIRL